MFQNHFKKNELIQKLLTHLDKEKIASRELNLSATHEEVHQVTPIIATTKKTERFSEEAITDIRFLQSFAGNDINKQKKYISLFLENAPKLMQQLQMGIEQKDFEAIKIAAHSFKTQLNYMGVKEEISHAQEIERLASRSEDFNLIVRLYENLKLVAEQAFEELNERLQ